MVTPDQIRRSWDDDDTPRSVFPEPLAERLTRENKELRRWKAEATEVILGLQDLGKALGIPLGERITGPVAVEAAQRLRGEVERLRKSLRWTADDHSALVAELRREVEKWQAIASVAHDEPATYVGTPGWNLWAEAQELKTIAERSQARLDALVADLRGLTDGLCECGDDLCVESAWRMAIGAVLDKHAGGDHD